MRVTAATQCRGGALVSIRAERTMRELMKALHSAKTRIRYNSQSVPPDVPQSKPSPPDKLDEPQRSLIKT